MDSSAFHPEDGNGPDDRGVRAALIAMALAGPLAATATAAIVALQSRRAERKHPPAGRFVEVDGVRLHYDERGADRSGAGEPVVLLHGTGVTSADFAASGVLDAIAKTRRTIVFDRPGFGYSERPRGTAWTPFAQAALIRDALRALGVDRPAVVVGHSWGTLVALALALEHPDAVSRLVLVSGYYFPTLRLDVPLLAPPAIPVVGDVLRWTVSPLIARLIFPVLVQQIFAPSPVPARFHEALPVGIATRPSQLRATAAEAGFLVGSAAELQSRYRELRVPVAIVAGAEDRVVDQRGQSPRLHETLPQSRLHIVPGAGHMVHYETPRAIVDLIEQREAAAVPASG